MKVTIGLFNAFVKKVTIVLKWRNVRLKICFLYKKHSESLIQPFGVYKKSYQERISI